MSALTTVDNVKKFLSIKGDVDDELLERIIKAASAFIENWLGREILAHNVIEYRDGNGKDEIIFGELPVLEVTRVSVFDRVIPASPDFQQFGYRFADWWLVLQGEFFHRGRRNVQIDYRAGYEVVPDDIEQAVIDLVSLRYKERDRFGVRSKTLAGETISYIVSDLSPSAKSVLTQYKKVLPI